MTPQQLDELGFKLSHDLKASLREIYLNLNLASQSLDHNDISAVKSSIDRAQSSSKKLLRLLDGLVGICHANRAESDEIVEMRSFILSLLSEFKSQIDANKIAIVVGPMTSASIDFLLIQEVWRQLIDNSIRYRGISPSQITINSETTETGNIFFIEDNGQKIEEHDIPLLFSAMTRDDHLGLGLLFCRRVIERLGGTIQYERIADKNRFSFLIPSVHP